MVIGGGAALVACTSTLLSAEPRPKVAIEDVAIVDVERGEVLRPRTVLIVDGVIAEIAAPTAVQIPSEAVRFDGKGQYLIPGLVDMHVHLFNNASHRPPNDWTFPLFVANGITGVREMACQPNDLAVVNRWRTEVTRGKLKAPHILAAGVAVDGKSPDDARKRVREARAAGADFIKVFSDVPETSWRAILEEARFERLPVCGHVPAAVSLLTAARAGQRSNEHLTQVYEACSTKEASLLGARTHGDAPDAQEKEVLDSFDRGVCVEAATALAKTSQVQVPTLVLPHFEASEARKQFRDNSRWRYLRPDEQARWTNILEKETSADGKLATTRWEVSREILGILHAAGVRILAGTDTPMPLNYPGWSLHKELELLVDSGMSAADALRAATIWPAEFLGISEKSGSVAVGKRADLVLLEDNPLQQISNTERIRAVVLDGRVLQRKELDALLEAARN